MPSHRTLELPKRSLAEPIGYGGYFIQITFDPLTTHYMTQKGYLLLKQVALGWFLFQREFLQMVEHGSQSVTMLIEGVLERTRISSRQIRQIS